MLNKVHPNDSASDELPSPALNIASLPNMISEGFQLPNIYPLVPSQCAYKIL